jgi:subtilisin family serine protease
VVVERMRDRHGCVDDWTVHSLLPGLLDQGRNPVDVLNLSFGGHTSDNLPLPGVCTVLDEFLDANPDVVVVASAGNEGDSRPVWPAALPRVVGVGALTANGKYRWPQSNRGSWVNAWTVGVDLAGPFVRWPATGTGPLQRPPNYAQPWTPQSARFEGWATWTGTSFAAARVSGAIAAELKRDSRTPRRVVSDLVDNATTRFESGAVVSPAVFP